MNTHKADLSLIKLKNFSISTVDASSHMKLAGNLKLAVVLLLSITYLAGCSGTSHRKPFDATHGGIHGTTVTGGIPTRPELKKAPVAPWEVWQMSRYPNESLKLGYRFSEEGNLQKASESFMSALSSARSAEEAEIALLGACSSLLKQGKSDDALSKISKYAALNNKKPGDLDARFSLITAYAYIDKSDMNQALAWFAQTYRASRGTGTVAEEARRGAMQYVRTFEGSELNAVYKKWQQDTFVASLVQGEESRRLQGGAKSSQANIKKWFVSETYFIGDVLPETGAVPPQERVDGFWRDESLVGPNTDGTVPNGDNPASVLTPASSTSGADSSSTFFAMPFGAYLPLSGVYQEHAKRVQEGVELALQQFAPGSNLITVDSEIAGPQAIDSLVSSSQVRAIFGPLVVKDIESVAASCERLRIPCVSFAKRKGITDLSSALFRLGANADNQVSVLLRYASKKLGSQGVVMFYPDNATGLEFQEAFNQIREQEGLTSLSAISYNPRSLESVHLAVEDAKKHVPDVIIIADTLTSAEPLLRLLKDPTASGGLARVPLLGTPLFADPMELRRYAALVEGAHIVSLFNPGSGREEVKNFIREYRKKYNREPDLLSALSYDATTFVLHAYRAEQFKNILKGNEVRALFESEDILGVSGRIRVLDNGELYRDLPVLVLSNGVLLEE